MLLIFSDGKRWADLPEAEQGTINEEYYKVTQEMVDAGVMLAGDPLKGIDEAKSVTQGGVVTDGPHAEASEVLGGYYVLNAPDTKTAVSWAGKLPGVERGLDRIEVREVQELG
jgi:hypothetical protein